MAYTLRQLSYAVAVVDCGSITDTSKQLGISQPAISAALKELEAEFKVGIFLRQPSHRISLSPAGQHFINDARLLLDEATEFETNAQGLSREVRGSIDVGCFMPTAPFYIPLIMSRLAEQHPGIDIRLHEGDLDELNRWLMSGQIEAALTYDMQPHPSVTFEPFTEMPPYALVSSSDPLASRPSVLLSDLSERNMIAFDLPITQQYYRGLFLSQGIEPNVTYYVKSYEMVRSLVGAGMGFSLLIMRPINDQSYTGNELSYVPLAGNLPRPNYGIAYVTNTKPRRLLNVLVDECRRILKEDKAAEPFLVREPTG